MGDFGRYRHVWPSNRADGRRSRYCINWIDDGGVARRRCYPTDRVRRAAARAIEARLNSWAQSRVEVSWRDLVTEYGLALASRSPGHQYKVARVLGRFSEICGPARASDISPAMCDRFMAVRAAGETKPAKRETDGASSETIPPDRETEAQVRVLSPVTLRGERVMLSGMFAWAVKRGYMAANPMDGVKAPRAPRRRPRPPRPEEWVRLLRALGRPGILVDDAQAWHLLILLGVVSGFRQSVLLRCYFGFDITDDRRIRALEQRHGRDGGFCVVQLPEKGSQLGVLFTFSGKTAKEGVVALPRVLTERITRRIGDLPGGVERLFPWGRWPRKAWERICAEAGVSMTFKGLRSASGTAAAVARAEQAGARHLEHSSAKVTREHYLDPELVAVAVAIGERLPRLPAMPAYRPRSVRKGRPPARRAAR